MQEITFGDNRKALLFGTQKINLHQKVQKSYPMPKMPIVARQIYAS
nr:hypothetical protein [Mannheimia haemolytica]